MGTTIDGRGLSRWLQLLEAVHFPDILAANFTQCYQLCSNFFGNAQECRPENSSAKWNVCENFYKSFFLLKLKLQILKK